MVYLIKYLRLAVFAACVIVANQAIAQINIAGSTNICLGNLSAFSYTPPSGKTVATQAWDFGDGFTANAANPGHLYKVAGSFTVKVDVTFSGGGSATSTLPVVVKSLPKAVFSITAGSDSCSFNNNICFKDLSIPAASGQNITTRLIIWGDGAFDKVTNPAAVSTNCHTYAVVDKYRVSFEITDKYGCKDFTTRETSIIPGVKADVSAMVTYPTCGEVKYCLKNESKESPNVSTQYDWNIDGFISSATYKTSSYCKTLAQSKNVPVQLVVKNYYGCTDTFKTNLNLKTDTIRTLTASDTTVCFGNTPIVYFSYNNLPGDQAKWYLNDSFISGSGSTMKILSKAMKLPLGEHTVKVIVYRGDCTKEIARKFTLVGPIAKTELFNNYQCNTKRKVFFVGEENEMPTPNYTYKWELTDSKGESCVAERAKDINKYKNCNESTDWWHKHNYTDIKNGYRVEYTVTDTVTGCFDKSYAMVNLDACGDCRGLAKCEKISICQNSWLFDSVAKRDDPYLISFDSGKTWVKYPVFIDTSYVGVYSVGLIYKYSDPSYAKDFGDDSIQIVRDTLIQYDTFLCNKNLTVNPIIQNGFTIETIASCNPIKLKAKLDYTQFSAGDSIIFSWAKGTVILSVTDTKDFQLDSVILELDSSGYDGLINVEFKTSKGCMTSYSQKVSVGFINNLLVSGPRCTNRDICFTANVYDVLVDANWDKTNQLGTIAWEINDSLLSSASDFNFCHRIDKPGKYDVKAILTDQKGCKDTITKGFFVQKVLANVTGDSRNFYCSQLRQFFDSSAIAFKDSGDFIKNYSWDWGTKKYSTLEKDPFKSFVGITDSIFVSHVAISNSGCTDTLTYQLGIITSEPKFSILDAIGCAPFEAEFINESKNSSQYIWEFGDQKNNTFGTFAETNVKFKYTQPGVYEINLIGIDTIYNPHTGSVYYCQNSYPGLGKKKTVTVLPSYKTGIESPDTICVDDIIAFKSLSDSGFARDYWDMGDGSRPNRIAGSTLNHTYKKSGVYEVTLKPSAVRISNQPYCHDSFAKKVITVLGVGASFNVDSKSDAPVFYFTNTSVPNTSSWRWDYDQLNAGSKTSNKVNGYYNYRNATGTYNVCLTATNTFGCKETACKTIVNDYVQSIQLYNAFTPGVLDGSNDEFDIEIVGEVSYNLIIYNRYGLPVFVGNQDAENGQGINWNGRVNNTGAKCAGGTYYYTFTYTYKAEPEEEFELTGVVTLIR